ncbi:MAG: D-alanyl-D-alanine carboxypeptidase [Oscillospiraceae bacterium]|nr:D-alanyl-D-alanine carboxypeptidase [Oscillospiraceae bacterium]
MSKRRNTKPEYYTQREWNRIQARERAQAKASRNLVIAVIILLLLVSLMVYAAWFFVIRSHDTGLPVAFDESSNVFGFHTEGDRMARAVPFADGLCVTDSDVDADAIFISATEGALFDINSENVVYAKNIFEQRSPASITKIMTALVALKYANPDDMVTVTQSAFDIEEASSVCELHLGDRLTLKQLLYGLLIASGNDAAQMIAEYVGGGSISTFVDMMNKEALALGATHTHFMNPHGLTQNDHYTCAYDIYLMLNAAMKYDLFMDIIQRKNYYAEYTDSDGDAYAMTWETTDHYLSGEAAVPGNVIIYGGKTGTTDDAGACLALISKDLYGNPYISVIMHSETKEGLYTEMNQILSLVPA